MNKIIGNFGEEFVSKYMQQKGYSLVERNFHSRFGEIDIIVKNSEYIVFIEVRTRKGNSIISGVESVDTKKQKKIIKTAMMYLNKNHTELQPRFDVVEVNYDNKCGKKFIKINHIENAFSWRDEYDETF
ncbi:MAG: hypothetical protein RUMPE_00408 [Eubacteriales bacterium SKADARSKE-1]|nr:hypothetical protein [Eubacteriales bacterium SKADARSKE-1]